MPTQVRFRRGTTAQNNNFTGAAGEITVNLSNNTIRVHDGSTQGGTELATLSHVTNSIANVIDLAPAALDTLNELAAALGDDPGFYSNIAASNGVTFNQANAAYDRANVAITYAGSAFDKANTITSTVAGLTTANVSELNNLYYTVDRANTAIDNRVTKSFVENLSINVDLGTQTTGAYVANLVAGTGITLSNLGNESTTPTIAIGQAVSTTSDVQFAKVNATSVVRITDSTQATGAGSGALIVSGGGSVGGNLYVSGNLIVSGTQTILASNTFSVTDPMIYLGEDNSSDVLDLGFIASFTNPDYQHTGFVRDASDGVWKLFANVVSEPSTTVDFTNATYSPIKIGALNATTGTFTGTINAVDIAATGNITAPNLYAYSDEKLKTNFEQITEAVSKVKALNGYFFNWTNNNQRSIGLKAQDVEKVIPDVVGITPDGFKSVNYMALTGLLVEAIKEQQDQINTLKTMIENNNG